MNNYTLAIASFIRFDVALFNTLEYAMKKDKYEVNAYLARKEMINTEITQNTPLKNVCDNSGEHGAKLLEMIKNVLDVMYSENSTIVKLSQDGSELRVDYSQAITIFETVMPIHDEICKVIHDHIIAARQNNALDDESVLNAFQKEERFYRGLVNMLMLDEFDHQFLEYNKARQEAKGGTSTLSNFIQNDITRLLTLFRTSRDRCSITSEEYYEMIDPLFALLEMAGGRRDLPKGKNFGDVFTSTKKIVREKVVKWENEWKPVHESFMKHFAEEVQKIEQNRNANSVKPNADLN
jgi:hypothetical protein